ncbi:MAG: hypothetical protein V7643_3796 [Mycobacterium sp.]
MLDYDDWPLYRSLEQARADGRVTPYCLGTGLDTLTLTPTILTVTVFDDDIFDELFGNTVDINAEGRLVSAADSTSVTDRHPIRRRIGNSFVERRADGITWRLHTELGP